MTKYQITNPIQTQINNFRFKIHHKVVYRVLAVEPPRVIRDENRPIELAIYGIRVAVRVASENFKRDFNWNGS